MRLLDPHHAAGPEHLARDFIHSPGFFPRPTLETPAGAVSGMKSVMGSCAEEIAEIMGPKADRQGILREIETYVAQHNVSPEVARDDLLKRYRSSTPIAEPFGPEGAGPSMSSGPGEPTEPQELRLRDVREGVARLRVIARVLTAERREIPRKDGSGKLKVLSGLLSDGSATLRFSWWDPPAADIERGSVLRVSNPQVRSWRDRKELSFGWKTQVELASEMELPPLREEEFVKRILSEIRPGEEGLRVRVRILFSESRRLTIGERERVIRSGLLADPSGRVPFTAWSDLDLPAGTVVELCGASVRTFQGELQLSLDERTRVEALEESDLPPTPGPEEEPPREIGRLEERAAGRTSRNGRCVVEGVVVEVRSPSGLVQRCPACSRSLQKGTCREHGAVHGEPDLRARLVVDDGTGVVTAQLSRSVVEVVLGMGLPQALELAREKLDASAVQGRLTDRTVGRRVRLLGRAVPGEWGITFFVDRWLPLPDDSSREAARLLADPRAFLREEA